MTSSNRKSRSIKRILAALAILVLAIPFTLFSWGMAVKASTVRAFEVAGGSMAPSLQQGDRVCVELSDHPSPNRGEIWIFRFPEASGYSGAVIKRVMGLPGDQLEVKSGKLWVNGQECHERYLSRPMTYTLAPVTLGPNQFYVLGDDRDASSDSHVWGTVPRDHFFGRVKLRLWPISKIGEIE